MTRSLVLAASILLLCASPAAAVQLTRSPYNAPVVTDSDRADNLHRPTLGATRAASGKPLITSPL